MSLPAPQQRGRRRPREGVGPVARPEGVPDEVGKVGGLERVRVDGDAQLRIWNTLMAREHPRGAGPFVGAQVRYLAASRHGLAGRSGVGGVGALARSARRLDRLGRCLPARPPAPGGGTLPAADPPRGEMPQPGVLDAGPRGAGAGSGFRAALRLSALAARDVRRRVQPHRGESASGQPGAPRRDGRTGPQRPGQRCRHDAQGSVCV